MARRGNSLCENGLFFVTVGAALFSRRQRELECDRLYGPPPIKIYDPCPYLGWQGQGFGYMRTVFDHHRFAHYSKMADSRSAQSTSDRTAVRIAPAAIINIVLGDFNFHTSAFKVFVTDTT